ncbi:hypothetical protein FACS189431_2750 [Alphaproteobacteria bacterium]|nr:hypothetical protein FACS189431_2750 [Alphaproteobacteria bacterium]
MKKKLSTKAHRRLSRCCDVLSISTLVITVIFGALFLIAMVLSLMRPQTASAECVQRTMTINFECTTIEECGGNLPGVGVAVGTVNPVCEVMCMTYFDFGGDKHHKPDGTLVYKCPTIEQTVRLVFDWLAIGVSIVVVLMVIVGAIRYMTAGGNQEGAKKGIEIIRNAIIALVLYMVMWALLNFLVPGGVFG